jgi:hypothetical protein
VAAADDMVAPPPAGYFAQAHFSHLHDGPQGQAVAAGAQLQLGVQVQGSHLQLSVIGELHWFGWWRGALAAAWGRALERSG